MPSYPEVTAEMIREFEEQRGSFLLKAPDNARRGTATNKKTNIEEQHIRWNESAQIESVEVVTAISSTGNEQDVYTVKFRITGTKGSGTLVGKSTRYKGRVNPAAWSSGNKEDGQWKMSHGTINRLTQLVRAIGTPVKAGLSAAQFAAFYPTNGESPLVGKEVYVEIHKKGPLATADTGEGWDCEVDNIFPLTRTEASVEV